MTPSGSDGVLLVAHGTIASLDELPEFLTRIRRGRPASPELVSEMQRRYTAIGGSPLLERTKLQAAGLARRLGMPVLTAMRLSRPTLEEALWAASELKLERLVVIAMAPFSAHVYFEAAMAANANVERERGRRVPQLVDAGAWSTEPALAQAQATAIREQLDPAMEIVLTAHSLPNAVIRAGDPYQRLFEEFAHGVERELGRPAAIAYQSQGADGGDWLGPGLQATLEGLRAKGTDRVLIAPIGFLAEHVETLYDLDHEAKAWCEKLGLGFARVPALDDRPMLIEALVAVTNKALGGR
jgi:protoporphyrin/coproporphyrin ferrochelatase